jgi:hypothetical protein
MIMKSKWKFRKWEETCHQSVQLADAEEESVATRNDLIEFEGGFVFQFEGPSQSQ